MDKSQYLKPREYEMLAILLPDQGEEETKAAIDSVLGYITEQNGTVDSVNADSPWGRRRLAYTVRHEGVDYRDGHYVLAYFTALPSAIAEIERELKLDTKVVRYLILIHDPEMGEKIDEAQIAEEAAAAEAAAAAQTESAPAAEAEEAPAAEAEAATETEEAPAPEAEAATETEEAPAAESEAATETEEAPAEAETEEVVADEAPAEAEETVAEEAPEAAAEEEVEAEAAETEAEESDKA